MRPEGSKRKGAVVRKDGRELRRVTLYLPLDLAKKLLMRAATEDRDMSDLAAELLGKDLG